MRLRQSSLIKLLAVIVNIFVFSSFLAAPFFTSLVALAAKGDGRIVYGSSGGGSTPQTRTRASASWSAVAGTVAATATINWSINEFAPTRTENLVGVISNTGTGSSLTIQRYNGSSWSNEWTQATASTTYATRRSFDIVYENSSGNAMVVYSDGTAVPKYRYWNGTAWSGPNSITVTRTTGNIQWVELEARPNSDEIALVYADANSDLNALVWNGSSWGSEPSALLEGSLAFTAAAGDSKSFDAAYENSGELLLVWGQAALGTGRYVTKAAGGAWGTPANVATWADNASIVTLAAEPGGDGIVAATIDAGTNDLQYGIWNGTAWTGLTVNADGSCNTPLAGRQMVDSGWVKSGGAVRAVVVYADLGSTGVDYRYWNGSIWTVAADWASTPAMGSRQNIVVSMRPDDPREMMVTMTDLNSDLWAKRLTFDGTNLTWSDTEGGATLEGTVSVISSPAYGFAYERYTPTTVGDGVSPANKTAGPSYTNQAAGAFTLSTSSGTDSVTAIQVTGTNTADVAAGGVKLWVDNGTAANEWDASDTLVTGGTASFSGATATFSGLSIAVTTAPLQYLVTYDITAAPTNGATLTAVVSSVTASNPVVNNDTVDAVLTIDAGPPPTVTNFNASDNEDGQSILTWTNPDPAANDLAEVLVRRKTGSYPVSNIDGIQVYQNLAPVEGGSVNYVNSPLTNGTTYYYAVFSRDTYGNWNNMVDYSQPDVNADTGMPTPPALGTTVGDGASPANKTVGPSYTNQASGAFTLSNSPGTDSVTAIQVTGTNTANVAAGGVKLWRDNGTAPNEWDASDTSVTGGTASFSGATAAFSGLSIAVTTAPLQYLVTYNITAAPTNGATLTAVVSSVTATNPVTNYDTVDAVLTIDAQAPTVNSFNIGSNNPTYANSVNVTLYNNVNNATEMKFADSIAGLSGAGYEPYNATKAYTLPAGDGTKTVYAQYKDAYGNQTIAGAAGTFDSIILDTTAPTISSRSPLSGATGVSVGATVTVTFNEANEMDGSTINNTGSEGSSTFYLKQGANWINATLGYDAGSKTATLDPSQSLTGGTTYTVYVTSGVKDAAGNPFAGTSWSFTTQEVVRVTSWNEAPRSAAKPQPSTTKIVAVQKLALVTETTNSTFSAIKIARGGSASAGDGVVTSVKFYKSTDGYYDTAGDNTLLGSGALSGGLITISLAPAQTLTPSIGSYYFIVLEINQNAVIGDTLGSNLANETYITLGAADVVTTFRDYGSKLISIIGEPHGSPGNIGAYTNTNLCSGCHTIHLAPKNTRILNKIFSKDPAIVNPNPASTYIELCFSCHDGSGSSVNVLVSYTSSGVNSGHKTDSAGNSGLASTGYPGPGIYYDAGKQLPCLICHDVHTSRNGNVKMISDQLYEYASSGTQNTGTGSWDASLSRWSSTDTTDYTKRARCEVCHRTHNDAAFSDGLSAIVGLDIGRPGSHATPPRDVEWCLNCHIDQHDPTTGESSGNKNCVGCHPDIVNNLKNDTTSYHHVMNNSSTTVVLSSGTKYPNDATPTAADEDRRCLMCHVDHDVFSPNFNALGVRAKNLRVEITQQPVATDAATFTNTDFDNNLVNGGICLSCHQYSQTKNTTNQKAESNSTSTPVINKTMFNPSAHNYAANSTYSDGSTFNAKCVKCHNTMTAAKYSASKQTSTNRFELHYSFIRRLLAFFGIIPQDATNDPLGEKFCYGCHSTTDNPNAGSSLDNYGVQAMSAAALGIKSMFAKTYIHPIADATATDRHKTVEGQSFNWNPASSRHVECEDCHNPHAAKAGNHTEGTATVGGPNAEVWGVTPTNYATYTTGLAVFTNGSATVTGSATAWGAGNVQPGWRIKNNYDRNGRWYTVTAVSSATSLTITPVYVGAQTPAGALGNAIDYTAVDVTYVRTGASTYQYEICLKCHSYYAYGTKAGGDTPPNTPSLHAGGSTVMETDVGLDFNTSQLAIHPVTALGKNQPNTADMTELADPSPSNWPLYTAGTVSATNGSAAVTGTSTNWLNMAGSGKSTIIAGWLIKFGTESTGGPFSNGWYQVASVGTNTSITLTTNYSGATGSGKTYKLGAGLGNAFVPPWGPWSRMVCTDCHKSDSATDPEGPHGSASRWILRQLKTNLTFDWWNGTSVVTVSYSSQIPAPGPNTFCLNCHRRDSYGDYDPTNSGGVYSPTNNLLTRIQHIPDSGGGDRTMQSGFFPKWNIPCMNCHGGDSLGGLHGTSAGKGLLSNNDVYSAAGYGNTNRGIRFLNGATWRAVQRAVVGTQGTCFTKNNPDEVNNCTQGHDNTGGYTANYNYP